MAFHDNPGIQYDRRNPLNFNLGSLDINSAGNNGFGYTAPTGNTTLDAANPPTPTPDMFAKLFGPDGAVVPGLNALGGLGQAYAAFQSAKTGKKALNFSMGLARTNLANNAQVYNTQTADRARASGRQQGLTGQQLANFVDNYKTENRVTGEF